MAMLYQAQAVRKSDRRKAIVYECDGSMFLVDVIGEKAKYLSREELDRDFEVTWI